MVKVINFIGEPSSGKSTAAGALFSHMKQLGYNCELVTEHAKLLAYQSNQLLLEDQLYVFSQQNSLMSILANSGIGSNKNAKLDYIITDSPLYLSSIYGRTHQENAIKNQSNIILPETFFQMVWDIYSQYNNETILMVRNHDYMDNEGRVHSELESNIIKEKILDYIDEHKISYISFITQNLNNPNFNLGKEIFELCVKNKIIKKDSDENNDNVSIVLDNNSTCKQLIENTVNDIGKEKDYIINLENLTSSKTEQFDIAFDSFGYNYLKVVDFTQPFTEIFSKENLDWQKKNIKKLVNYQINKLKIEPKNFVDKIKIKFNKFNNELTSMKQNLYLKYNNKSYFILDSFIMDMELRFFDLRNKVSKLQIININGGHLDLLFAELFSIEKAFLDIKMVLIDKAETETEEKFYIIVRNMHESVISDLIKFEDKIDLIDTTLK